MTGPRGTAMRPESTLIMSEEDLLIGLLNAAHVGGWLVSHIRRSDLGITQGDPGLPDIIAAHPARRAVVVIECKSSTGRVEPDQRRWLDAFLDAGIDARVVKPDAYEETWRWLVGDRMVAGRRTRHG